MTRYILPLLGLLCACAPDTVATVDGFDVSCSTVDDCMAVLLGDVCSCACEYGAINAAEAEAWADYDADLRVECGEDIYDCGPCPDAVLSCEDLVCAASAPVY